MGSGEHEVHGGAHHVPAVGALLLVRAPGGAEAGEAVHQRRLLRRLEGPLEQALDALRDATVVPTAEPTPLPPTDWARMPVERSPAVLTVPPDDTVTLAPVPQPISRMRVGRTSSISPVKKRKRFWNP